MLVVAKPDTGFQIRNVRQKLGQCLKCFTQRSRYTWLLEGLRAMPGIAVEVKKSGLEECRGRNSDRNP